ncbi:MAG: photosystem II cytochrome c-550 [Elainellaceae cyanobacterium]
MLKRYISLILFTLVLAFQLFVDGAIALELNQETRTLPLNENGDPYVLSIEQVALGKRQFNYACAQCHVGGGTRTNPNIDLSSEALKGANPPRDNIESLVDYMKNPTTYDGFQSIAEVHPATSSSDVFPKMRNLTEEDLVAIAGFILLQPKVRSENWAGGKANN